MTSAVAFSRAAAVAFATVGLFLCPFRCAEAADARFGDAAACSSACGCADSCDGDDGSAPTPTDDCRGGCIAKALVDGAGKISPVGLSLLTAAVGRGGLLLPAAGLSRSVGREASPTHPGLGSGVAIRIAISSLIL